MSWVSPDSNSISTTMFLKKANRLEWINDYDSQTISSLLVSSCLRLFSCHFALQIFHLSWNTTISLFKLNLESSSLVHWVTLLVPWCSFLIVPLSLLTYHFDTLVLLLTYVIECVLRWKSIHFIFYQYQSCGQKKKKLEKRKSVVTHPNINSTPGK